MPEDLGVIEAISKSPVVKSSSFSYQGLTGTMVSDKPVRSCRYGGDMFCSENKPLRKLTITKIVVK